MPAAAAIPAITSIGGSILGAIGSRGAKSTGTTSSSLTPVEPEYFSQFRQGLLPQFQNMMYKASQDVYGPEQKAAFMGNLNKLNAGNMASLRSALAKNGALNSGRFASAAASLGRDRLGQIANYNIQTPLLNRQASQEAMGNLLNMGMNFAGRAPVGQNQTGNQTQISPNGGFMSGLASNLGGVLGAASFGEGPFGNMSSWFGPKANFGGAASLPSPSWDQKVGLYAPKNWNF